MNTNNNEVKEINTNHLIALCEIFDDYKSFYKDLEELIKSKTDKDLVQKVYDYITEKKRFFRNKKYDAFITKHRDTIDIMKKHSSLSNLTVLSYDIKGERKGTLAVDYFFKYLEQHQEDIETIKQVALKIKELGIDKITFGEHLDFTNKIHLLNLLCDSEVAFLNDLEIIPAYPNHSIKYKTKSSPYLIYLHLNRFGGSIYEVSKYQRKIELNSLVFNPDLLPNEITVESTIWVIKGLAEKQKEGNDIKDSVDIRIATDSLKKQFESLKKRYDNIDKVKDNQELKDLLLGMQNIIAKLQVFGENFEQAVIDTYPSLNKDIMKKEKTAEEDRRYNSSIDCC